MFKQILNKRLCVKELSLRQSHFYVYVDYPAVKKVQCIPQWMSQADL